ncbi:hypothetical protein VNI00_000427 [Paramarasmius palmivorus]|uniref:GATA-type domain-containing protein n=1 Tax=Paramarasmius palmivorus TaxID=297713 RepID=A0AAW0EEJ3_9AGAR
MAANSIAFARTLDSEQNFHESIHQDMYNCMAEAVTELPKLQLPSSHSSSVQHCSSGEGSETSKRTKRLRLAQTSVPVSQPLDFVATTYPSLQGSRHMRGEPELELPDRVDSAHDLYPRVPEHSGGTFEHQRHYPNATTRISDQVERECFNCFITTSTKWRRSRLSLSAGEVLCYKCSLFERSLGRPRPLVPLDATSTTKEQPSSDCTPFAPLIPNEIVTPPAPLIPIQILPFTTGGATHSDSLPPPDWDSLLQHTLRQLECFDSIEDDSREEVAHPTARNLEESCWNFDPSTAKQDGVEIDYGGCVEGSHLSHKAIDSKHENKPQDIPEHLTHMPSSQGPLQIQYTRSQPSSKIIDGSYEEVCVAHVTNNFEESCGNFDPSTAKQEGVVIDYEKSMNSEESSYFPHTVELKRECKLQNTPEHITQTPSFKDGPRTGHIEGCLGSPSPSPETIERTWEEVANATARNEEPCCNFDPGHSKIADEDFYNPESTNPEKGSYLSDTEDIPQHIVRVPSSQDTLQTQHPRQIVDEIRGPVGNSEDIRDPYITTSGDPLPLRNAHPELEIIISREAERPARGLEGSHNPERMDNDFDLPDATRGTWPWSWLDRIFSMLPSGRFYSTISGEGSQPKKPGWPGEYPIWSFQLVRQYDLDSEAIPPRRHLLIKEQLEGYHPKSLKDAGPPFGDSRFLDTRRKRSISSIHAHVWWKLELGRGGYTYAISIKDSVIIMRDQHGTTNTGDHNRTDNGNRYSGSGPSVPSSSTPGSRLLLTQQQKRSVADFATFSILTMAMMMIVSTALLRPDLTSTTGHLAPPEPPPLSRAHFISTFKATVRYLVLDASGSSVLASIIHQLIDLAILLTIVVPLLMYITFWLRKLFGVLWWTLD